MALFKKTKKEAVKKEDKKVVKAEKTSTPTVLNASAKRNLSAVLKRPRITEKGAVIAGTNNVYPFDIDQNATKKDVADAIKMIYKVTPVKVAVLKVPAKSVRSRRTGKMGTKAGGKKAYVYLKKGDKIEFV